MDDKEKQKLIESMLLNDEKGRKKLADQPSLMGRSRLLPPGIIDSIFPIQPMPPGALAYIESQTCGECGVSYFITHPPSDTCKLAIVEIVHED